MTSIYDARDITTKSIMRETSTPSQPLQTSPIVDNQSDSIIEQSKDKLLKKTGAPAQFESSNYFPDIVSNGNNSDYSVKDSVDIENKLLFELGHFLCITDLNFKDYKWLGEVLEIKEAAATEIKLVIRIAL